SDSPNMADGWWSSLDNLKKYDIIFLSCEGQQYDFEKSPSAISAMESYINLGGRVFASHWHNIWMASVKASADRHRIAQFRDSSEYRSKGVDSPLTTPSGMPFEKGNALADWMLAAGASPPPPGRGHFVIKNGRSTVEVNSLDTTLAQRFVTYSDPLMQ